MSEQKKLYTVSQDEKNAICDVLDNFMQTKDTKGIMVLCCAFMPNNDIRSITCAIGAMGMDEVTRGITTSSGYLMRQIEQQREQRCAETPVSEVRQ